MPKTPGSQSKPSQTNRPLPVEPLAHATIPFAQRLAEARAVLRHHALTCPGPCIGAECLVALELQYLLGAGGVAVYDENTTDHKPLFASCSENERNELWNDFHNLGSRAVVNNVFSLLNDKRDRFFLLERVAHRANIRTNPRINTTVVLLGLLAFIKLPQKPPCENTPQTVARCFVLFMPQFLADSKDPALRDPLNLLHAAQVLVNAIADHYVHNGPSQGKNSPEFRWHRKFMTEKEKILKTANKIRDAQPQADRLEQQMEKAYDYLLEEYDNLLPFIGPELDILSTQIQAAESTALLSTSGALSFQVRDPADNDYMSYAMPPKWLEARRCKAIKDANIFNLTTFLLGRNFPAEVLPTEVTNGSVTTVWYVSQTKMPLKILFDLSNPLLKYADDNEKEFKDELRALGIDAPSRTRPCGELLVVPLFFDLVGATSVVGYWRRDNIPAELERDIVRIAYSASARLSKAGQQQVYDSALRAVGRREVWANAQSVFGKWLPGKLRSVLGNVRNGSNALIVDARKDPDVLDTLLAYFDKLENERGEFAIAWLTLRTFKHIWETIYELPALALKPLRALLEAEGDLNRISTYRGHFIHQFQVFLLGILVLAESERYCKELGRKIGPSESIIKAWLVTASLHDVAVPLNQLKKWVEAITKSVVLEPHEHENDSRNVTELYRNRTWFSRSKNSNSGAAVDVHVSLPFLLLSRNYRRVIDYIAFQFYQGEDRFQSTKDNPYAIEHLAKALLDFALLEHDHGVLSALFVASSFLSEKATFQLAAPPFPEAPEISLEGINFDVLMKCCVAISIHNDVWKRARPGGRKLIIEDHPLAFLLVFCDNVEQWGRPKLSEGPAQAPKLISGTSTHRGGYNFTLSYPPEDEYLRQDRSGWKRLWRDHIDPLRKWSSGTYDFCITYSLAGDEAKTLWFFDESLT